MMLDIPNDPEAQWLISQGVSDEALLGAPCLRAGRVRFLDDNTFEFASDSQRARIARRIETFKQGRPEKDAILHVYRSDAARLLNVSPRSVASAAYVKNNGTESDRADVASDGVRAIIFRVVKCGTQVDLVAWSQKLGRLATWRGSAFALGQDAIWNPATYFAGGALRLHRTALDWLKSDRDGICIVQPRHCYSQLRHVRKMVFADAVYGAKVRKWMEPPKARTEFLVEIEQLAA